ncbi:MULTISPECIES: LLM class F420-dependent oxidoreductase [Actinomadura]|uniref:LLM class F420-dependent oxidoreductase n=1 Tax=Actinomadura yumaensis TaxID=111807 RepID=A0ABW2CS04_9ACTN|nr:LLM class F420-dependent oxidoreductase [Actinomadura sp. J1-007]MWK40402.1 TIGR03564 family F420-dependent LLM class oxidoreductase [Actinomadura sp. J1-007]
MRIGVALAERNGPDALERLIGDVRRAAEDGLASIWIPNGAGMDMLTALAVVGTRVPGIELVPAVVPTYPRHPAALAQQARTAAFALGPGRLTLGVGTSHKIVVENAYGYDFDRPVRHMQEYLSVLVPLLNGESVAFDGDTVRARIGLSVPNRERVPLLMAALGPRMLKLAGERADGTVLWMTGPRTVRDHIVPTITAAAESAGRPRPRVVCMLPVAVTDDAEGARKRAAEIFGPYGALPSYRAMMDREGAEGPADLAVVGDEQAVRATLDRLAAAGVTDFVAGEFMRGEDRARTREFLKTFPERPARL